MNNHALKHFKIPEDKKALEGNFKAKCLHCSSEIKGSLKVTSNFEMHLRVSVSLSLSLSLSLSISLLLLCGRCKFSTYLYICNGHKYIHFVHVVEMAIFNIFYVQRAATPKES